MHLTCTIWSVYCPVCHKRLNLVIHNASAGFLTLFWYLESFSSGALSIFIHAPWTRTCDDYSYDPLLYKLQVKKNKTTSAPARSPYFIQCFNSFAVNISSITIQLWLYQLHISCFIAVITVKQRTVNFFLTNKFIVLTSQASLPVESTQCYWW